MPRPQSGALTGLMMVPASSAHFFVGGFVGVYCIGISGFVGFVFTNILQASVAADQNLCITHLICSSDGLTNDLDPFIQALFRHRGGKAAC